MPMKVITAAAFAFCATSLPAVAHAACLDGFCTGDAVIYEDTDATIQEIFPDQNAQIELNTDEYLTVPLSELQRPVTTMDGYSAGDAVIYEDTNAVIEEVFPDGYAKIELDTDEYITVPISELERPLSLKR